LVQAQIRKANLPCGTFPKSANDYPFWQQPDTSQWHQRGEAMLGEIARDQGY